MCIYDKSEIKKERSPPPSVPFRTLSAPANPSSHPNILPTMSVHRRLRAWSTYLFIENLLIWIAFWALKQSNGITVWCRGLALFHHRLRRVKANIHCMGGLVIFCARLFSSGCWMTLALYEVRVADCTKFGSLTSSGILLLCRVLPIGDLLPFAVHWMIPKQPKCNYRAFREQHAS